MSLYIPHVFSNIGAEKITYTFESLGLGKIKKIDFVTKMGNDAVAYNAVYVHFDYWFDTSAVHNFHERIRNPNKEARIVYDDPWYWIVLENKTHKHVPNQPKERIALKNVEEPVPVTPPKKKLSNRDFADMFRAPVKNKQFLTNEDRQFDSLCRQISFNSEEDYDIEAQTQINKMSEDDILDEIENLMLDDDNHLISIDGRYIQVLEEENNYFRNISKDYFETIGYTQHQLNLQQDELMCLRAQLSILQDNNGFANQQEMYY